MVIPKINPSSTILIIDTTYFGNLGVVVFRCWKKRKNILWKFIHGKEKNKYYTQGIVELQDQGWVIEGIVCDGKPLRSFPDIPTQMCIFHQVKIVRSYITKNPKLQAGKELKHLMSLLKKTDRMSFTYWLNKWHRKWKEFLVEKTINPSTGKWNYTHQRLRKAIRSVRRNLPYLFIWEDYFDLGIPTTTNSVEGMFSVLKGRVSIHRGLRECRKIKLICELLS